MRIHMQVGVGSGAKGEGKVENRLVPSFSFALRRSPFARTRSGFSLLEILVSIVILAAFFGVVYETVIVGLREVETHDEREDARRQVTQALDRLVREAGVATEMDAAETDRIQFDTDAVNNVEYEYDGSA